METTKIIIDIISLVMAAVGVVMIYDSRRIAEKRFSYSDRNSITKTLKIVGFVLSIIGAIVIMIQSSIN